MNATSSLAGTSALSAGNNPVSDVAGRAHQAVDQAADKATPALERAQAAAHRTIDKVADTSRPPGADKPLNRPVAMPGGRFADRQANDCGQLMRSFFAVDDG